jgi:hypothetical protein
MKKLICGCFQLMLVSALGLFYTARLEGTSIEKMNLLEMVNRSGRIIVGTCVAVAEKTMPMANGGEIAYTSYTFAVSKSIKGQVGATMELRQFSYPGANSAGRVNTKIVGMPVYRVNEEYLLILTSESQLGLSAPVGLPQGCFKVSSGKTGAREVVNGMNNAGLFHNFPSDSRLFKQTLTASESQILVQKQGPLQYDVFVGLLEKMVR